MAKITYPSKVYFTANIPEPPGLVGSFHYNYHTRDELIDEEEGYNYTPLSWRQKYGSPRKVTLELDFPIESLAGSNEVGKYILSKPNVL